MSCNVGEILVVFLAMLFKWPIPLLPIHLLWINLLTDSFPALALGVEKKEPGIMEDKPRDPNESIINKDMVINIVVQSIVMTIAVLGAFYFGWKEYGIETGRTYAFVTLITSELLRAYSARSERLPLWKIGVFTNKSMNLASLVSFGLLAIVMFVPALQLVFNVTNLNFYDWDLVIISAAMPLLFGELTKVVKRYIRKGKTVS